MRLAWMMVMLSGQVRAEASQGVNKMSSASCFSYRPHYVRFNTIDRRSCLAKLLESSFHGEDGMQGRHFVASASMVIALLLLGGCTTTRPISPTNYAAYAEGMKGSPAIRRDEIRKCIATVRFTPQQRDTVAKLMNLAPSRDPRPALCQRVADAIASGRLTYGDLQQMYAGEVTPKLIRIVQAR